jgi:hypothetical protein
MSNFSFIDFYIGYPGHPRYTTPDLIEDDVVRVIIQKYEVVIFTNKGELLGDPNFGADLIKLLNETRLSSEAIEADIKAQIADYIPEIDGLEYDLTVEFLEDPERHQEVMVVNFSLNGYQVDAFVK